MSLNIIPLTYFKNGEYDKDLKAADCIEKEQSSSPVAGVGQEKSATLYDRGTPLCQGEGVKT